MCKFLLSLIVYTIVLKQTHGWLENYLYMSTIPKCCKQDQILLLNSSNPSFFECIEDVDKNLQLFSDVKLVEFQKFCLDTIIDIESGQNKIAKYDLKTSTILDFDVMQIPKCCPFNSSYDLKNHNCVQSPQNNFLQGNLSEALFVVKAGLSECTNVIKDYQLLELKDTDFLTNSEIYIDGQIIPYGKYCMDEMYNEENYVVRVCHQDFDFCKKDINDHTKPRCIRKCCEDGKIFKNGPKCEFDFSAGLNFENDLKIINGDEPFATIQGHNCRKYLVNLDWNYTLDDMGNINLDVDGMNDVSSAFEQTYCFENFEIEMVQTRRLFLCFKYVDKNIDDYHVSRIALILSSVFLLLTLIGYGFLPEMRNLHGKTLMCHCLSLLIAFTTLTILQFNYAVDGLPCKLLGYFIMYTFLTAFMWSNIMCFDIWWTFGSMREQGIHQKEKEMRRFLSYTIYALTLPALVTGAAYITQHFGETYPNSFSESMQAIIPTLGRYNCFFEQKHHTTSFLVWFVLPLALIISCNLVLYVKTVIYFYQVKKEIDKMTDLKLNRSERKKLITSDMEKLTLAVKLFLIMGVSWLFESLSVCFIPVPATGILYVVQIIFDLINSLQGVFIFCIFVLKAKFIKALQRKLGLKYHYLRRTSHSMASAASTTTDYLSGANILRRTLRGCNRDRGCDPMQSVTFSSQLIVPRKSNKSTSTSCIIKCDNSLL